MALIVALAAALAAPVVTPLGPDAPPGRPVPTRIVGRAVTDPQAPADARHRRQWPGTYAEAAFRGPAIVMAVGPGDASWRVRIDGGPATALTRARPGYYRIDAGGPGAHRVRIDVASEHQAAPTAFGDFVAPPGTDPLPAPPPRARAIEFIGDSHTVGYGVASTTRDCTRDEVRDRTDATLAPPAILAARYDADDRVEAISGRGVVRNYDGAAGATVPAAWPDALLDGRTRAADDGWLPQVIAIALGTNDLSTPVRPGERWRDEAALRADYVAAYVRFVRSVRARSPGALIVLWATDAASAVPDATRAVADRLRAGGDRRIAFVPVRGLRFAACDAHPDTADDRAIAAAIAAAIDARPDAWSTR